MVVLRLIPIALLAIVAFLLQPIHAAGRTSASAPQLSNVGAALVQSRCDRRRSTVLSPSSVQQLLGVLSLAASDELAQRLMSLASPTPSTTADATSVGIWVPLGMELVPAFASEVGARYQTQIFLAQAGDSTQLSVERWLRENTTGLIGAPPIENYSLVIASALDLTGRWLEPFDRRFTRAGTLAGLSGPRPVSYMNAERILPFAIGDSFKVVRLYLAGGGYVDFLLANDKHRPACALLESYLQNAPPPFTRALGGIELPRFRIDTSWLNLVPTLKLLGVGAIVDESARPLTRLVRQGPVAMRHVRHSASIAFDERGVKGAAATLADVQLRSPDMVLKFNRPFAFVVWDQNGKTQLFSGVFQ